jgi:hypothetical protein
MPNDALPGELPPDLQPPRVERRFAMYPAQWLGLALLMLVPALALAGVFGESRHQSETRAGDIALRVSHPARTRFEQIGAVDVLVTNTGPSSIDTVRVAIDTAYLSRFAGVAITPAAAAPFEIELTDVAAGQSRLVHVEIDAMRPGRHRGVVSATAGRADTARVEIATIVFP